MVGRGDGTDWASRRRELSQGWPGRSERDGPGPGRLGFAAVSVDWETPFLGPLYAWSSAIQGKSGPMQMPAMIKVLFCWLAERLETGDRLQRPCRGAWIGGFLEMVPGCHGPWFSLEVTRD